MIQDSIRQYGEVYGPLYEKLWVRTVLTQAGKQDEELYPESLSDYYGERDLNPKSSLAQSLMHEWQFLLAVDRWLEDQAFEDPEIFCQWRLLRGAHATQAMLPLYMRFWVEWGRQRDKLYESAGADLNIPTEHVRFRKHLREELLPQLLILAMMELEGYSLEQLHRHVLPSMKTGGWTHKFPDGREERRTYVDALRSYYEENLELLQTKYLRRKLGDRIELTQDQDYFLVLLAAYQYLGQEPADFARLLLGGWSWGNILQYRYGKKGELLSYKHPQALYRLGNIFPIERERAYQAERLVRPQASAIRSDGVPDLAWTRFPTQDLEAKKSLFRGSFSRIANDIASSELSEGTEELITEIEAQQLMGIRVWSDGISWSSDYDA